MRRKNYTPLKKAKIEIIQALEAFDPDLGQRASSILSDDRRLNIVEVTKAQTNMMMCRPAGITMDDIIAANMYIPDFADKFGPHFTQQDNPNNYAIIDFEYDGSPRAIVWLAHELGHAIADDIQRENGHNFRDFSPAEMEEQAYLIQHVVSRHVRKRFGNLDAQETGEDVLQMSFDRATQFTNAENVFESVIAEETNKRAQLIQHAMDQRTLG